MNVTTSSGWLTIARWLETTSTVCAPMRLANIRSASGGMASSFLATRYDVGYDFQAGLPITSSNVDMERPCCTANNTRAFTGSTSADEVPDKVFFRQPAEPLLVNDQVSQRRRRRPAAEQRAQRLALSKPEGGDVYERDDVRCVGS